MTPLSPEDSHHVIDATAYSWPYIGIALLGGVARAARFGVRSVRQFLCGLLCSGDFRAAVHPRTIRSGHPGTNGWGYRWHGRVLWRLHPRRRSWNDQTMD